MAGCLALNVNVKVFLRSADIFDVNRFNVPLGLVGGMCGLIGWGTAASRPLAIQSLPLRFHRTADRHFAGGIIGEQFYFDAGGKVMMAIPDVRANTPLPVISISLQGANQTVLPTGEGLVPKAVNYLIGSDSAQWRTGLDAYERLRYVGVYRGIDLLYYGSGSRLEYDFIVHPRASTRSIRLSFSGVRSIRIDSTGDLVIDAGGVPIRHSAPRAYQKVGGHQQPAPVRFVQTGETEVGFEVGPYDYTLPLVIDPVLQYATFLGGSEQDSAYGIALDSAGCAYITGVTMSANFPADPLTETTGRDIFVVKLSANGSSELYATIFGGTSADFASGIAVDSSGEAYVAGYTLSPNFPVTSGAYHSAAGGMTDVFMTKLSANGSQLLYSTTFGGSNNDYATAIALDTAGEAYVTGYTASYNFPTVSAQQASYGGGSYDAFILRMNSTGSALIYSSYLGGSGDDTAYAVAVDQNGDAYITGASDSTNFPLVTPLFQKSRPSITNSDAFVASLNSSGQLTYSTYLGGSMADIGYAIAVDQSGAMYVAGTTNSYDFPVTPDAYQTVYQGAANETYNGFIAKFNPGGGSLAFATYLGGSGSAVIRALALGDAGDILVGGTTASADFPVVNSLEPALGGGDSFLSELSASGSALLFSTYISGSGDDVLNALAAAAGFVVAAGSTSSSDLPVTPGAFQRTLAGYSNAFVAQIVVVQPSVVSVTPSSGTGAAATFTAVYADPGGFGQLNLVQLLMPGNGGVNACWVYYTPQSNSLWLMNDSQTAALGPVTPGGAGSVANSQCVLNGAGSSASSSGTNLTVTTAVTFKPAFAGSHSLLLYAQDVVWQNTGWQALGTWTVMMGQPSVVSVAPSSGSGAAANFTAAYRQSAGFGQLNLVQLLIPGNGGVNACWVYYTPQSNSLWLMNNSQTAALGPVTPGGTGSVANSQCVLNGAGSSASGSGTNLTVTMAITFNPAFAGSRSLLLYAQDVLGQNTGWQALGAWTVTMGQPSVVLLAPSSGGGAAANFTAVYRQSAGFGQLNLVQLLIPGNGGVNACWVYYTPQSNSLWLMNDSQTAALGPVTPGASGSVANSQCVLSGAGSSASGGGTNLTVTMAITFNPAFAGSRSLLLYAQDVFWQNTGWQSLGTWTVTMGQPSVVLLAPSSGGGAAANFTAVYGQSAGFTQLNLVQLLIPGNGGVNACWVYYTPQSNTLWLMNDAQTAALGPVTPGGTGSVTNSQCVLNGAGSSTSGSGTNLTVTMAITFKPAFAGSHSLLLFAQDVFWQNTGWQALGAWTVPAQ